MMIGAVLLSVALRHLAGGCAALAGAALGGARVFARLADRAEGR